MWPVGTCTCGSCIRKSPGGSSRCSQLTVRGPRRWRAGRLGVASDVGVGGLIGRYRRVAPPARACARVSGRPAAARLRAAWIRSSHSPSRRIAVAAGLDYRRSALDLLLSQHGRADGGSAVADELGCDEGRDQDVRRRGASTTASVSWCSPTTRYVVSPLTFDHQLPGALHRHGGQPDPARRGDDRRSARGWRSRLTCWRGRRRARTAEQGDRDRSPTARTPIGRDPLPALSARRTRRASASTWWASISKRRSRRSRRCRRCCAR